MNSTLYLRSFSRKFFALLVGLGLALYTVPFSFAVSTYAVLPNTGTVGTSIPSLELEYTVDTTVQTWANADTLVINLPANIGPTGWSGVTFTAEFDEDVTNDGAGESVIAAGGGDGQYAISGPNLTIRWNETAWTADSTDTIRVLITSVTPQYADATTDFVFSGTTAAGGDTNPSGTATTNISAGDPNASVVFSNPQISQAALGNTAVTFTPSATLDANDTIEITFPSYVVVPAGALSGVNTSLGISSGTPTMACNGAGQVVTCTVGGSGIYSIATGTINFGGLTASHVGTTDITDFQIEDENVSANDISLDTTVALTNVTAGDAAATVTLSTNSVVAVAGNTTVSFTTTNLDPADAIRITFPSYVNVSAVAFVSTTMTFAGGPPSITCSAAGQIVSCVLGGSGQYNAPGGSIVMSGITGIHSGTTDITSFLVEDEGVTADQISTDSSVALTDIAAADAAATVALAGNATVGGTGNTTATFTTPVLDEADVIRITFPAYVNVASAAFVSTTLTVTGGGTLPCAGAGQIVSCTVTGVGSGVNAGTGNLVISGIAGYHSGNTDITSFVIENEGASGNNYAADATVSLTDIMATDPAATVTLAGNAAVGGSGNTTIAFTTLALDQGDAIRVTLPDQINLGTPVFVSTTLTLTGGGTLPCSASGQVLSCIVTGGGSGVNAGTGNVVVSGLSSISAGTTDITVFTIEDEGITGDNYSVDAAVALTDSTTTTAAASVTFGGNAVEGEAGATTITFTTATSLDVGDTIRVTFPSFVNIASASFTSTTLVAGGGSPTLSCAASGQVLTCTVGGTGSYNAASSSTIVVAGITTTEGTTDISSFLVQNEGVTGNDISLYTAVTLTDVAAAPSTGGTHSGGGGGGSSSSSNDDDEEEEDDSGSSDDSDDDSDSPFSDLSSGDDYYDEIVDLQERGVIDGYADGTVGSENGMNRAELMKIVVMAVLGETPDATVYQNCYGDVTDEWFAPYVCYATEQGWVSGYPDGTFRPGDIANNAEILKMILNTNGVEVAEVEEGRSWYTPYVDAADELGLIHEEYFTASDVALRGYAFHVLSELLGMM